MGIAECQFPKSKKNIITTYSGRQPLSGKAANTASLLTRWSSLFVISIFCHKKRKKDIDNISNNAARQ